MCSLITEAASGGVVPKGQGSLAVAKSHGSLHLPAHVRKEPILGAPFRGAARRTPANPQKPQDFRWMPSQRPNR